MPDFCPGAIKTPDKSEPVGMRLYSPVDLVAIEGKHDGGVGCGRSQRIGENSLSLSLMVWRSGMPVNATRFG